MRTAVFTFGRFNPPTTGHALLANKVASEAKKTKGSPFIFTGQTQDKKKNPLNYKDKIRYMSKSFKGVTVVNSKTIKTLFDALEYLEKKGFDHIVMVVGSDRVSDFKTLLGKYLKRDYDIDSFDVVSAGERDPDADDVSGMSASKMRAAVQRDDYDSFRLGCPPKLPKEECLKMFKGVKRGLGIRESIEEINENWFDYDEFELFCEKVSVMTRRKMAKAARRTAKRRAVTRKRKQKRMKSKEEILAKAKREAKKVLRKKAIGGKNWSELSITQRAKIDDIIAKRGKGAIAKLSKKLLPKVKVKEKERLIKARSNPNEEGTAKLVNKYKRDTPGQ